MLPIIKLLVVAARAIADITSAADNGAYKISTMFPCILPIIKDEEEWEKDCCITCIAINPGARKTTKGNPSISDLTFPNATDKTRRNNNEEMIGDKSVCIQTIKNLRTSFLYKVHKPTQFIKTQSSYAQFIFFAYFNHT